MKDFSAIIVAAGTGSRFQGGIPKQYMALDGKALICHSLECFARCDEIHNIVIVYNSDHESYLQSHVKPFAPENTIYIKGGKTRSESVRKGLEAVKTSGVLIHDAARPFVSDPLIKRVCEALSKNSAVIPAIPVIDTIKKIEDNTVQRTEDRTSLRAVQTPQGFCRASLMSGYSQNTDVTDESQVFEAMGIPVTVIEGETENFKITYPQDWDYAEFLTQKNNIKKAL